MRLYVDERVRGFAPSREDLARIASHFSGKVPSDSSVYILPPSMANEVLGKTLPPRTFRAFTRGSKSYLFPLPQETRASIAFLMAHELCHQAIDMAPVLKRAFDAARIDGIPGWSDRFHEVSAEERYCDNIAHNLLGTWYDREWWRHRVGPEPRASSIR